MALQGTYLMYKDTHDEEPCDYWDHFPHLEPKNIECSGKRLIISTVTTYPDVDVDECTICRSHLVLLFTNEPSEPTAQQRELSRTLSACRPAIPRCTLLTSDGVTNQGCASTVPSEEAQWAASDIYTPAAPSEEAQWAASDIYTSAVSSEEAQWAASDIYTSAVPSEE